MKQGIEEFSMIVILFLVAIFVLKIVSTGGSKGGWDWVKAKFSVAKAN